MPQFEALYSRKCRFPLLWEEVGEPALFGPIVVQESVEKVQVIRQRMKAANNHYKSYADKRRRPLEF